jgi:plasmid stabilization system protein ParE
MDCRVIISNPALQDLETIARFIAQGVHGSPAMAAKIGEELIVLSESLAKLPYRGIAVKSRPGLRKLSHRYYQFSTRSRSLPDWWRSFAFGMAVITRPG